MANKKKHIDDLFKDNLQGSQLPLDGSEWDRLAGELHPKKKKRFVWWWFGIGILLVSAAGLLYYNLNSTSLANQTKVQNPVEDNTKGKENRLEENASQDDITEESTDILVEKGDNIDGASKSVNVDHVDESAKRGEKDNETIKSTKTISGSNSKQPKVTKPQVKTGSKGIDASSKVTNQPFELLTLLPKSSVTLYNRFDPYGAPMLTLDERLDQKPPIYIYPMASLIDTFGPLTKFIDPFIGLSLGGSQLSQQLNSNIANYTPYRNGNESASFRPNVGFDIGAGVKGMQIATGLKYQEKGQENSPMFKYEVYDSVLRVDVNGDTSYPRYNYRDTLVNGVTSPRYRYVTIPLSIGKTIYDGNKFDLTVGINTNIQYLIGGTGTILNGDLNQMPVQRLSGFNRLSLTYGGYIASGYALNDRMKLRLLVRYDADALDMMKINNISQKMSGFGTDLSIQFKLKK